MIPEDEKSLADLVLERERLNEGVTKDRVPTTPEPLNTILQAIVQHATDSGMSFDDLRVLNRLIEKIYVRGFNDGIDALIARLTEPGDD